MPEAAHPVARITPLTLGAMLGLALVWGPSIPATSLACEILTVSFPP